jgi:hypothetical protein
MFIINVVDIIALIGVAIIVSAAIIAKIIRHFLIINVEESGRDGVEHDSVE